MEHFKIYHNTRCRKSREGLAILTSVTNQFEVVDYINNPLSKLEIKDLLSKLGIKPLELVRVKEAIWKDNYKEKALTDDEIIEAMVLHPRLIERPIIVKNNEAIIGRPVETIAFFITK